MEIIEQLEARDSIRHLIADYSFAMDEGRIDALLDLFAPDGSFEIYGRAATGRVAILGLLGASGKAARSLGRRVTPYHAAGLPYITLAGDGRARAQTYVQVITNEGLDHCARYDDDFTQFDGQWRIAHRKITIISMTRGGLGEHLAQAMTSA